MKEEVKNIIKFVNEIEREPTVIRFRFIQGFFQGLFRGSSRFCQAQCILYKILRSRTEYILHL